MTDEKHDNDRPGDRAKPSGTTGKGAHSQPLGGRKENLPRQKVVRNGDTVLGGALLDDVRRARAQNPPALTKAQLAEKYRFDILQVLQAFPGMKIADVITHLAARDPNAAGGQFNRSASASVKALATARRSPTKSMPGDVAIPARPTTSTTPPGNRSPDAGLTQDPTVMPPRPRSDSGSATYGIAPGLFSSHLGGTR